MAEILHLRGNLLELFINLTKQRISPMKCYGELLICTMVVSIAMLGCGPVSPESGSGQSLGSSSVDRDASSDTPLTRSDPSASPSPAADSATEAPTSTKTSDAEPWGHLRGRFVYAGSAPEPAELTITKDQDFCGKHPILDESLVVKQENGGIANVVVYLYPKRGQKSPEIHASYADSEAANIVLDNEQCRFQPRVCLLRTNQTLVVGNKDQVGHNTKIDTTNNSPINPITPAGATFEHRFEREERSPAAVSCSIHPWMNAWLLVRENPYFAISDEDGAFEIKFLPAGSWTFQVWHERAQAITEAKVRGKLTSWSRGRMEMAIGPGETVDLGDIEFDPGLFAR